MLGSKLKTTRLHALFAWTAASSIACGGSGTPMSSSGPGPAPGDSGDTGTMLLPETSSTGEATLPGSEGSSSGGVSQETDSMGTSGGRETDRASASTTTDAVSGTGTETGEEAGLDGLPDPGPEGDGDYEVGPNDDDQPELGDRGAPRGRLFRFTMSMADSEIFDGTDPTLDPGRPQNRERNISVYVPDRYEDGTPAPVLVIQDGDGPLRLVQNVLDNLTISEDPERRLPAFIAIAVQNGGSDAQGSQRGLEYDTMSDRYARFIDEEVFPAVLSNSEIRAAYPELRITSIPSGRATMGCSSGGAAAFTMAWFRPDLFSRVIAYSTTLVDQQDHDAPEHDIYPHGAWDYHSELELIANAEKKPLRIFLNVNERDNGAEDAESTLHNWVMANQRTAADLAAKGYHYRYVYGRGATHCAGEVQRASSPWWKSRGRKRRHRAPWRGARTKEYRAYFELLATLPWGARAVFPFVGLPPRAASLADALVWVWRGYEPATR